MKKISEKIESVKKSFEKKKIETANIFLDTNYKNLVQFKHACLNDYIHRGDTPNLHSCTCGYFKKYRLPCWHMYQLALSKGIFKETFEKGKILDTAINSLSKGAMNTLAHELYSGYYETPHSFSNLKNKSFKNVLLKSGLIIQNPENDSEFVYSKEVQENIYYILYCSMKDENLQYYYNN